MNATSVLAISATVFGVVMSLAPITQIKLILRTRQSADVSVAFVALILAGVSVWLAYGISLNNEVLIISELIGVITNATAVVVILWFRRDRGPSSGEGLHSDSAGLKPEWPWGPLSAKGQL